MQLVIFLLGVLLGAGIVWLVMRTRENRIKNPVNAQRRQEREGRKQKILEFLQRQGRITNNQVEKLIGVSDATATQYLEDLEQENKIIQRGSTGRKVYYTLK